MARPKSATHDIKRDAILDIAAQCFADRSYPAASMNEIAAACGTSKARLYHYYESKDAILFDLLDRHTQRLLALIAQTEAKAQRQNLDDFPNIGRWFNAIQQRPATVRAYEIAERINPSQPPMSDEAKKVLFGQDASTVSGR